MGSTSSINLEGGYWIPTAEKLVLFTHDPYSAEVAQHVIYLTLNCPDLAHIDVRRIK